MKFAVALVGNVIELVSVVTSATAKQVAAISTCFYVGGKKMSKLADYKSPYCDGYLLRSYYTSAQRHPTTPLQDPLRSSWAKAVETLAQIYEACDAVSYATAESTVCEVCCRSRCDSLWLQRPWPRGT